MTRLVELRVGVCLTHALCAGIHIREPSTFFMTGKLEAAEMLTCSKQGCSVSTVACCEMTEMDDQSPRVTDEPRTHNVGTDAQTQSRTRESPFVNCKAGITDGPAKEALVL